MVQLLFLRLDCLQGFFIESNDVLRSDRLEGQLGSLLEHSLGLQFGGQKSGLDQVSVNRCFHLKSLAVCDEIVVKLAALLRLLELLGLLFANNQLSIVKNVGELQIVLDLLFIVQIALILKLVKVVFNLLEGRTESLRLQGNALAVVSHLFDILDFLLLGVCIGLGHLLADLASQLLLLGLRVG